MKTTLSIILFLSLQIALFAQAPGEVIGVPPPPEVVDTVQVFTIVEQMPEYVGGYDVAFKYIADNLKYPKKAKKAGTQGRVFVEFVVMEDGSLDKLVVRRGLTGKGAKECDYEAIRVISSMPKWNAGMQNGKAVRVSYILPFRFK